MAVAFWAVIATGALLRVEQFATRGSLWSDEAMFALNIASRSFGDLLAPLNHDQYAPVLFLWSERLSVILGGVSEWTLRALPLLAGTLLLVVVGLLARRLFGDTAALVALAITALCPALIFYSSEAKPYGVDALVAAGLVYLAVELAERPQSRKALVSLLLAGLAAIWFSSPAAFTLAGVGAGLLLAPSPGRSKWAARIVAMAACWAANFLAAYLLLYSRPSRSEYIARFWADTYFGIDSVESLIRSSVLIIATLRGVFLGSGSVAETVTGPHAMAVFLWLFIPTVGLLGVAHLRRTRGAWASALLIGPGAAMALASVLGVYPVAARLTLFAVPLWIVLMAGGISWITSLLPAGWRPAGILSLGVGIPLVGVPERKVWVLRDEQWNDGRAVIENLRLANSAQAPIYVSARGVPVWLFYTTNWAEPDLLRLSTLVGWTERGGPAFENAPSRGRAVMAGEGAGLVLRRQATEIVGLPTGMQLRSRTGLSQPLPDPGWAHNEIRRLKRVEASEVWLVFLYSVDSGHLFLTRALDATGARPLRRIMGRNAYAYLYDFRGVNLPSGER